MGSIWLTAAVRYTRNNRHYSDLLDNTRHHLNEQTAILMFLQIHMYEPPICEPGCRGEVLVLWVSLVAGSYWLYEQLLLLCFFGIVDDRVRNVIIWC